MQFDMNRAWNDAVVMITGNREVLLTVAGIFFFLPGVLSTLIMPKVPGTIALDAKNIQALDAQMSALFAHYWWVFLLVLGAQLVGYLALLSLLGDRSKPTVGRAIADGFAALLPALGAYILFFFGFSLVLGTLLSLAALASVALSFLFAVAGLVAMIFLGVRVSLSAPVIAIERVYNPLTVLRRSWDLTTGNTLMLFAFYLLIGLAYIVLSFVLGLVSLLFTALGSTADTLASAIFSGVTGTALSVVLVAVLAAVHRQLAGPSPSAIGDEFS